MSMQMAADIDALKARIKALEEAIATRVSTTVHEVEHATKDDIDAFLGRLRAIEGKIEALGRKKP